MIEKLCKCGCGQPIIIKRHHKWRGVPDFIHGHSSRIINGMKGKKHKPETLKKYSKMRIGKPKSEEHKKKIGESQKGRIHTPQCLFKKGNTIGKGRKHSKETRKKMSEARKGFIVSDETRKKISDGHRGIPLSKEHKRKLSLAGKNRKLTEKHKNRISKAKKKNWQDPEFCKMMGIAWGVKPNKLETRMLNLLNDLFPNEWKYTGDFSFIINGKCPDFTNCNGKKKLIEVFGNYWHKGENPKDRAKIFKPFGYETLVIWEKEFQDMKRVIKKIENFHKEI